MRLSIGSVSTSFLEFVDCDSSHRIETAKQTRSSLPYNSSSKKQSGWSLYIRIVILFYHSSQNVELGVLKPSTLMLQRLCNVNVYRVEMAL